MKAQPLFGRDSNLSLKPSRAHLHRYINSVIQKAETWHGLSYNVSASRQDTSRPYVFIYKCLTRLLLRGRWSWRTQADCPCLLIDTENIGNGKWSSFGSWLRCSPRISTACTWSVPLAFCVTVLCLSLVHIVTSSWLDPSQHPANDSERWQTLFRAITISHKFLLDLPREDSWRGAAILFNFVLYFGAHIPWSLSLCAPGFKRSSVVVFGKQLADAAMWNFQLPTDIAWADAELSHFDDSLTNGVWKWFTIDEHSA